MSFTRIVVQYSRYTTQCNIASQERSFLSFTYKTAVDAATIEPAVVAAAVVAATAADRTGVPVYNRSATVL